jgi:large subunit ribosomal protein L25
MVKLEVKKREIFGRKVKNLIKEGFIPAEIYGHGFENIHVALPAKDFIKVFKQAGESSLVTVNFEGNEFPVVIHDIQKDNLGEKIIHVDLYRVRMDEKIRTKVPLKFINEPPAVKEKGGILVKTVEEVEIEALPANLPHELEVDLSKLVEIHQTLHGSDIIVPSGVKVFIEPEMGIATVIEPQKEEAVQQPKETEAASKETSQEKSSQNTSSSQSDQS